MLLTTSLIFTSALALVAFFIKRIIYVSHEKHLFDEPHEARKIHKQKTPNLGGVAIVITIVLVSCLFSKVYKISDLNYTVLPFLILFLTGVTDDLIGVKPVKKMLAQLAAALIVTLMAESRFTNLYGLFGMTELSYAASIFLSTLFITFIVNAFNLIDGINCLAGALALIIFSSFSFYFYQLGELNYAFFSIAMSGCLVGFLWFNKTPAKIFMGDTGSLFIGFSVAILSIHFLEINNQHKSAGTFSFASAPSIVAGLLIIPAYDTLRVFAIRIWQKKSPFAADRNHIHHRLIDLGLSHMQATSVLILVNLFFLFIVFLFRNVDYQYFLLTAVILVTIFNKAFSNYYTAQHKKLNTTQSNENLKIRILLKQKKEAKPQVLSLHKELL